MLGFADSPYYTTLEVQSPSHRRSICIGESAGLLGYWGSHDYCSCSCIMSHTDPTRGPPLTQSPGRPLQSPTATPATPINCRTCKTCRQRKVRLSTYPCVCIKPEPRSYHVSPSTPVVPSTSFYHPPAVILMMISHFFLSFFLFFWKVFGN